MKQVNYANLKGLATSLVMTLVVAAVAVAPVSACSVRSNQHANSQHANNQHVNNGHAKSHVESYKTSNVVLAVSGDNGSVKVHQTTTSQQDHRNEPKVCGFNLAAFGFDANQQVNWYVVEHTHGKTVLSGSQVLTDGNGKTADYTLANGMYKLYWNFNGEHGSAKHKVFKAECPVKKVVHVKPVSHKTPTPQAPVSTGHVLATSTNVPGKGAAELANTGTNTLIAVAIAIFLTTAAVLTYVSGAKSLKQSV